MQFNLGFLFLEDFKIFFRNFSCDCFIDSSKVSFLQRLLPEFLQGFLLKLPPEFLHLFCWDSFWFFWILKIFFSEIRNFSRTSFMDPFQTSFWNSSRDSFVDSSPDIVSDIIQGFYPGFLQRYRLGFLHWFLTHTFQDFFFSGSPPDVNLGISSKIYPSISSLIFHGIPGFHGFLRNLPEIHTFRKSFWDFFLMISWITPVFVHGLLPAFLQRLLLGFLLDFSEMFPGIASGNRSGIPRGIYFMVFQGLLPKLISLKLLRV